MRNIWVWELGFSNNDTRIQLKKRPVRSRIIRSVNNPIHHPLNNNNDKAVKTIYIQKGKYQLQHLGKNVNVDGPIH